MVLGELALGLITELVAKVLQDELSYRGLDFFHNRRIRRRIEDATAEIVEPLISFLGNERISEDKQRRLIETCVDELRPLADEPNRFFQGSLDGQKIFERLYAQQPLPQVVREDATEHV